MTGPTPPRPRAAGPAALRRRLLAGRRSGAAWRRAEGLASFLVIRRSGLFDPAWYAAQELSGPDDGAGGRRRRALLRGHSALLAHYVWRGRVAGRSPHPLVEPAFFAPGSWRDDPADPFARLLLRGRVRRAAPHPLFDPEAWIRRHPEAADHRYGPFGHFCATAGPETVLPAVDPIGGTGLTWARGRAGLEGRLAAWRSDERRRIAVQARDTHDAATDAATVGRLGPVGLAAAARNRAGPGAPLVSVVMPVRDRAGLVGAAIASVRAQTLTAWELVVVDDGSADGTADVVRGLAADDPRIRLLTGAARGVCAARNAGAAAATGRYVAWLDSDNAWVPHFLACAVGGLESGAADAVYAATRAVDGTGRERFRAVDPGGGTAPERADRALDLLAVSNYVDLNVLVVTRELLADVGGFDESLRRTVDYDLVWRIVRLARERAGRSGDGRAVPRLLPFVGVDYRHDAAAADRITVREPPSWREVVKNRHLIDWAALRASAGGRDSGRTSVLVAAVGGWAGGWRTATAALRTADADRADVEVVVVDDALARGAGLVLAALALADERVRVLRSPQVGHRALATNLALARSSGAVALLAEAGAEPWPGAPGELAAALADPGVAAAQPVLLAADGTVASAGAAWAPAPGDPGAAPPADLFAGLPVEDARRAGPVLEVPAATGGLLAARAGDVAAAGGLDCRYVDAGELTELSLRLAAAGPRRVVTVTAAAAGAPDPTGTRGPAGPPPAGAAAETAAHWAAAGFGVAWPGPRISALPRPDGPPLPGVAGPVPSLRWAIKISAPVGPVSRRWGDLHFARALGAALERLGQQVVVDHRPALQRDDHGLDDVVLVLRGLFAAAPPPDRTGLLWVISHPDLVTAREAAAFDRVFAAGPAWAARAAASFGRPVQPLLQATDPAVFHPDPAVADTGEPVLFIGNSRGVHRPVVRDLVAAGVDVGVHGAQWEGFLDPRHLRSTLVANADLAAHYRSAGVVLNDHWDDMRAEGFVSNRLFDAAASGARVVSDHVEGIEDLFGGLVRTYRDSGELVRLVRGAAEAFPPAAERAALGRRIGAEHSFDARAAVLLRAALEVREAARPADIQTR